MIHTEKHCNTLIRKFFDILNNVCGLIMIKPELSRAYLVSLSFLPTWAVEKIATEQWSSFNDSWIIVKTFSDFRIFFNKFIETQLNVGPVRKHV